MSIPSRSVGFITGHKGEGLRSVEGRTGTFIFTNASDRGGDSEEVTTPPLPSSLMMPLFCFCFLRKPKVLCK